MKFNQLEALIAIADGNGIAGAAQKLHISQPAVTKSLANLELNLGVDLIDRSGYRLKLTEYGNSLLAHARSIKSELEKARLDIELLKNKGQVFFRYSGSPGTLPKLVPQTLQRARKGFPALSIEITGELLTPREKKIAELAAGTSDLLICSMEPEEEFDGLISEPLLDVDFIVIAGKNHPSTQLINPTLKMLRDYEWLVPSKYGTPDRLIKKAFREAGSRMPDNVIALGYMEMLASFVRNGEHLAFVPYHPAMVDGDYEEFRILDVCPSPLGWTLHTVQRASSEPSAAVTAFITAARELVKESEEKRNSQHSAKTGSVAS